MFRDVPGCSGMFRNAPECSMFLVLSTPVTKCFMQNFFNTIEGSCYSVVAFSKRIPKYYTISKISTNQTRELDCEVANQVSDLVFNLSGKVAMVSIVKKKMVEALFMDERRKRTHITFAISSPFQRGFNKN